MAECTKRSYADLVSARLALRTIRKRSAGGAAKTPRAVYPCAVCRSWHLTSKRPSKQVRWVEFRRRRGPEGNG